MFLEVICVFVYVCSCNTINILFGKKRQMNLLRVQSQPDVHSFRSKQRDPVFNSKRCILYEFVSHVCGCWGKLEEGTGFLGIGVTDSCKLFSELFC